MGKCEGYVTWKQLASLALITIGIVGYSYGTFGLNQDVLKILLLLNSLLLIGVTLSNRF